MFCFSIGTVPLMLGFGSAIAFLGETLYGTGIEGGFDFNCGHGAFNGDTGNCAGWTELSADIPDGRHRFTEKQEIQQLKRTEHNMFIVSFSPANIRISLSEQVSR